MAKIEILRTNKSIRCKLRWLMEDTTTRRVVLVAFVGAEAIDYLRHPEGIELYCWPNPGGTNPAGLRQLLASGVDVQAVNNLHMKVFWSKRRGAIVGSANLTANGLGDQGLHELAVFLPPGHVDIDAILGPLHVEPLNRDMLNWLEQQRNLHPAGTGRPAASRAIAKKGTLPSFVEWVENATPSWRLYWWTETDEAPRDAVDYVERATGKRHYHDYLNTSSVSHYRPGEWVLSFRHYGGARRSWPAYRFEWFVPQIYGRTSVKSWGEWCHFWFQSGPHHGQVPFSLDRPFPSAFRAVLDTRDGKPECLAKFGTVPRAAFLKDLAKEYRSRLEG
jgi:hypothetical protein